MADPNSSMEDILKEAVSTILAPDEIPFKDKMGYLAIAAILAAFFRRTDTEGGTMSKKLRKIKKEARNAAKGGRNGKIFEHFMNAHNARMRSPRQAFEQAGSAFAEGFRQDVAEGIKEQGG